jgi:hypothetical protein
MMSCRSEIVHQVRLDFKVQDSGAVRGFACNARKGGFPMATRIGATRRASLVVDLFRAPGLSRCSSVELLDYCKETDCYPIAEARKCFDLEVDVDGGTAANSAARLGAALQGIKGPALGTDVPGEAVVIKVVGLATSCADALATPERIELNQVVGCATSCPIVLKNADLDVRLDLDVVDDDCEGFVNACATGISIEARRDAGAGDAAP